MSLKYQDTMKHMADYFRANPKGKVGYFRGGKMHTATSTVNNFHISFSELQELLNQRAGHCYMLYPAQFKLHCENLRGVAGFKELTEYAVMINGAIFIEQVSFGKEQEKERLRRVKKIWVGFDEPSRLIIENLKLKKSLSEPISSNEFRKAYPAEFNAPLPRKRYKPTFGKPSRYSRRKDVFTNCDKCSGNSGKLVFYV